MKKSTFVITMTTTLAAVVCFALVSFAAEQQRSRRMPGRRGGADPIMVGSTAPDFTLLRLESYAVQEVKGTGAAKKTARLAGPDTVTLSSFKGKQPVVLFFSSYT
jgi:hypothetical protein